MAATDVGKTREEPFVSQRNLIYIVGALVLVIIIVYFLWPFPAA